jgi:hypothetical protein
MGVLVPRVRFIIHEVFDIAERSGLVVKGQLLEGQVAPGDVLELAGSSLEFTVETLEFPGPLQANKEELTLVIRREDDRFLEAGDVLFSD